MGSKAMFYFEYAINRDIRVTSAKKHQRRQILDNPYTHKIMKIQERMQRRQQTTKLFLLDLGNRKKIDSLSNSVLFLLSPILLQTWRVPSTLSIMPLILMSLEFMTRNSFNPRPKIIDTVVFVLVWILSSLDDFVRCGDADRGVGLGTD
ncbi:hypothetical protein N7474_007010 [Penicillium riverlandense]|uniref:uncharacterized protein n=1 Tax=Penicillium riverlandense TaxID=1903569 RepID=UPI002548DEB4|nr:uncharacterized protein N7474_007010 [Penicillium riverlandense]KAJ5815233.1 hypothetical protein N7474_007010 [Penicillium riverlandense]